MHIGAYAALAGLDEAAEAALYQGLADMGVAGLEQPFTGRLHHRDDAWLLGQVRPAWTIVLTTLPGTMDRLQEDKYFGLASADQAGRSRALDFAELARLAVAQINMSLGRPAVRAVELHSAPRLGGSGAKSSLESFVSSLSDLRARDWSGATLLVEHCDAAVPDHPHDKGFLRIEDDVLAAKLSQGKTPLAISINWGRSALETRSAGGPLEHIRRAKQAGLMGALFFSGVTPHHPEYGSMKDSHAPFSTSCPESWLTPAAAKAALATAPDCPIVGLKLQTKPATMTVPQRLAVIKDGFTALFG